MNYFNEVQIQRILNKFPQEVKDTVELKGDIPTESGAKGTIAYVISHHNMAVYMGMAGGVNIEFDFGSSVYEGNPSKIYEPELREIEKELSNIFGYKVKASVEVLFEGEEPEDIPPLYFGELEKAAEYRLFINVCTDKPL